MNSGPMRNLPTSNASFIRWKSFIIHTHRLLVAPVPALRQQPQSRNLAQVRPEPFSELWFTPSLPSRGPADELLGPQDGHAGTGSDHKPPDERILKLGRTLRILSPLLANILRTPLPQEILSPSVSLHLFPSTHPHLPAVKGRMAYRAALWTAPVAWGCVPIVGNVKLTILSERIVRTGFAASAHLDDDLDLGEEKLVVRFKTEKKSNGNGKPTTAAARSSAEDNINRGLSTLLGGDKPIFSLNKDDEFMGIFIFSFDSKGRIATHTIEHSDETNGFDKTSRVVTLTDWLLGKARWGRMKEEELVPSLAMRVCRDEWRRNRPPSGLHNGLRRERW